MPKPKRLVETLSDEEIILLKKIVRRELIRLFFILYTKRAMWGAE